MSYKFLSAHLLAALVFATAAHAATFTVTTTADEFNTPSGAAVSLREALRDSTAFPGADTITFAPGLAGPITLTSAQIIISSDVTLDATSIPGGVTITDAGNVNHRLFDVNFDITAAFHNITFAGGGGSNFTGEGGAILSFGALTLTRCTFSGNSTGTSGFGGAILSFGALTLTHCTLSGNSTSSGSGGAISNYFGPLALMHCTLSNNSASTGGAIYADPGSTVTLTNCIVAENTATSGADIYNNGGTVTRVGANLVQSLVNTSGGTDSGPAANPAPPLLAPLAACGGPTQTRALLPGSPALNSAAVLAPAITADQRGFPIVGVPDIGAYEAGTLTDFDAWVFETLPATATATQRAATFDYDGDGRTLLLEYAGQFSPTTPDSGAPLGFTRNPAGSLATIVMPYRPNATDLLYTIERNTNLGGTWTEIVTVDSLTNIALPIAGVTHTDSTATTLTFTDTFISEQTTVFYRLRATQK